MAAPAPAPAPASGSASGSASASGSGSGSAAIAAPARRHSALSWAVPVTLGAVFGFYAGFLRRTGEAVGWWDVLYGVVAGVIFTGLAFGLGRVQRALPREIRAAAYGALCGIAMGFLHSLTGTSVLRAVGMGLIFAAVTAAASFYLFYTRD